jgi:hypothetical protein
MLKSIGIAVGVPLAVCCCLALFAAIAVVLCARRRRRRRIKQQQRTSKAKSVEQYETIYGEIQLPTLNVETLTDEPSYDMVPTQRTLNMSYSGVMSAAQEDSMGGSSADSSESSSGTIQIVRSKSVFETRL